MDIMSPLMRQLFVASSPQLAAISIGAAVSYPNILLEQLKSNNSTFQLDMDTATWIGSTHGLAGLPSIFMPSIMQIRGRKFAFILSCLFIILGWILAYIAKSTMTIIIGEMFHGLGGNCLVTVSMLTISEMVEPKFRAVSMICYGISQTFGMCFVIIIGQYLHWKTVSLVMGIPIIIALVISCTWPESPSWLAYKGKFEKCEIAFNWLRGVDINSQKELSELIAAQKECRSNHVRHSQGIFSSLRMKVTSRDFYIPCFHMFVLLYLLYWIGTYVLLIYTMDVIRSVTRNESAAFIGLIVIYVICFIGTIVNTILIKYFRKKTVITYSGGGNAIFLLLASIISFLQSIDFLEKDSLLCFYCIIGFMITSSVGSSMLSFTMSIELMPVKHRGLGGALFVILICLFHSSSLKLSPYLFLHINLYGTFLLYSINAILCTLYIWKYVPDTDNRTLQEIEDYFNHGRFIKRCTSDDAVLTQRGNET